MIGWIIALVIIIPVGIGAAIGVPKLSREHQEAKNLLLNRVDFTRLKDGTYIGKYEGGMYGWRENEAQVTVESGKVTKVEFLQSKENQKPEFINALINRVIEAQSLQVDAISGATLTSKAYLQGIENALTGAMAGESK